VLSGTLFTLPKGFQFTVGLWCIDETDTPGPSVLNVAYHASDFYALCGLRPLSYLGSHMYIMLYSYC